MIVRMAKMKRYAFYLTIFLYALWVGVAAYLTVHAPQLKDTPDNHYMRPGETVTVVDRDGKKTVIKRQGVFVPNR